MTRNDKPDLFVVDGSNIATEGRSKPSLSQLTEAVAAFREQYPRVKVTVVVDATFGHRIAKKEVAAFDAAVAANELVTPPAGAVGRGDAFILAIADKAGAGVFSNDSFQEFHGEYEWLFETGRLIGGKPVPHVGWVFVDRNPVRGRRSREAVKAAKRSDDTAITDAKELAQRRVRKKAAAAAAENVLEAAPAVAPAEPPTRPPTQPPVDPPISRGPHTTRVARPDRGAQVNDPAAFFDFVERHPVGTTVSGQVDSYASHGAYVTVGAVRVYVPLRLMADPPPTSARRILKLGDDVALTVAAFVPDRLSIDAALASIGLAAATAPADGPAKKKAAAKQPTAKKKAAAKQPAAKKQAAAKQPAAKKTAAKRPAAAKKQAAKQPAPKKAAARQAAAKQPAAKQPAAKKKAAAEQSASGTRSRRSKGGAGA